MDHHNVMPVDAEEDIVMERVQHLTQQLNAELSAKSLLQ